MSSGGVGMRTFVWSFAVAATLGALSRLAPPAGLLAFGGMALLFATWRWHQQLALAIAPLDHDGAVQLVRYPSVTIVRPVRGRDVGAEDNFRAALDTGYPGDVETVFVFDDQNDPGLPVARQVVAEHRAARRPGRADVVVAGSPPPGRTGK